ncbi:MAG: ABC transporter substrate-binding protein [Acidimicrobiales bacterium]
MPGYHLPFFGAAASGLFAEHGLDVEILDPPPGPDMNISHRVAAAGADFSLTGLTYHLFAHRDAVRNQPQSSLAARFVAVLQPRAGLAAVVPADSPMLVPADLAGRRLARSAAAWLADECAAALVDRGIDRPALVSAPDGPAVALARGDAEMVATFVDTVGVASRAGFAVRAIHTGMDIYGSGLIAGDHVPAEVVAATVAAVGAAFDAQRLDPEAGVADFCRRFEYVPPARALASWLELEPYAFAPPAAGPTGSMTRGGWRRTLDWLGGVHGLGRLSVDEIAREEFCLDPVNVDPARSLMPV